MKRRLIVVLVGILLIVSGFALGRVYQHVNSGYYLVVRSEKDYTSSMGAIHWSYVTESVGMPIHDPGTTMIMWKERTLYKAKRDFQERRPFADNLTISDGAIAWDDGEYHYHLTIAELKKK